MGIFLTGTKQPHFKRCLDVATRWSKETSLAGLSCSQKSRLGKVRRESASSEVNQGRRAAEVGGGGEGGMFANQETGCMQVVLSSEAKFLPLLNTAMLLFPPPPPYLT